MTTNSLHTDSNEPRSPDAAQGDAWTQVRRRLAARAEAEGLVDVALEQHDSPLGPLLIAATGAGIVALALPTDVRDGFLAALAEEISPRVLLAPRTSLTEARRQLDEYFDHRRQVFELELDWRLTRGFRREVLLATARIPYGSTGTYTTVAREAGNAAAVRAAGTALALNPIPIVVPCHRVLRAGGALGNYRGGTDAKAELLRLEGAL